MNDSKLVSFRFTQRELETLDKLVFYHRQKNPYAIGPHAENRTSVLKLLMRKETERIAEEDRQIAERLEKVKEEARQKLADLDRQKQAVEFEEHFQEVRKAKNAKRKKPEKVKEKPAK